MSFLDIKNISMRFGSLVAVDDVSTSVEKGETFAIIGPNGAGKTTLFNLISGLMLPTSGLILLDGKDLTLLPAHERVRSGIARTFQTTEVFSGLSMRENLRIAVTLSMGLQGRVFLRRAIRNQIEERVSELVESSGLVKVADRVAGELSLADQRTAEIMMALARSPKLLLLDEPAAGMAADGRELVVDIISKLRAEGSVTIILVEHDMNVIFGLADRILVLAEGRVLAVGSPAEIADNAAVQKAYLGEGK